MGKSKTKYVAAAFTPNAKPWLESHNARSHNPRLNGFHWQASPKMLRLSAICLPACLLSHVLLNQGLLNGPHGLDSYDALSHDLTNHHSSFRKPASPVTVSGSYAPLEPRGFETQRLGQGSSLHPRQRTQGDLLGSNRGSHLQVETSLLNLRLSCPTCLDPPILCVCVCVQVCAYAHYLWSSLLHSLKPLLNCCWLLAIWLGMTGAETQHGGVGRGGSSFPHGNASLCVKTQGPVSSSLRRAVQAPHRAGREQQEKSPERPGWLTFPKAQKEVGTFMPGPWERNNRGDLRMAFGTSGGPC